MKKLNVKRLAAIGVGAALMGSALAPLAYAGVISNVDTLTKSSVVDSSGNPVVSVVAGNEAAVSDWIWAGNIAAKVAQLATLEKQVTVTGGGAVSSEDATVDFTVGGTVTVKGGKTYFNNLLSGAQEAQFNAQTTTNSTIPSLIYQGSKNYTANSTTSTVTMQEQIVFTANPEFDETITNQALTTVITSGNLQYRVDLGSGIPATENPAVGGSPKYRDDSNDDVRIPLFGKEYLVQEVDKDSSPKRIILVEAGKDKIYKEGDEITGLVGRDGKEYKVVVGTGVTVSSVVKINLTLFDSEGNEVATDTFAAGDVTFYSTGNPVLQTLLNIKEIQSISTEGGGTIYRPVILLGSNRIEIRDGQGFPYDSTKKAEEFSWTSNLTFSSDSNYLTRITIQNSSQNQWTGAKALRTGAKADLPEGYGSLKIIGLQLPEFTGVSKTERLTTVVVGDEKFKYRDSTQEADHTIPLYVLLQGVSSASNTASFVFDQKTIYVDANLTDRSDLNIGTGSGSTGRVNGVTIRDINRLNGEIQMDTTDANGLNYRDVNRGNARSSGAATIRLGGQLFDINGASADADVNNESLSMTLNYDGNLTFKTTSSGVGFMNWYYQDKNASARRDSNSTLSTTYSVVSLQGQSDINANYVIMVDETSANTVANIWLMLAYQTFTTVYNKRVTFEGTDVGEIGRPDNNSPFYAPNSAQLPTDFNGGSSYNVNNYKVAEFTVEEDQEVAAGIKDMNFWVDTTGGTGDLLAMPNTQLSVYTSAFLYDENRLAGTGGHTFRVDPGQTQYPDDAYSDFGSRITISTGNILTLKMPENRPQFEILIEGTEVTREVSGGESFTDVPAGETKTTEAGAKVTIDKVTVGETTVEGAVANPSTYKEVVPVGRLVYSDSVAPVGSKIIVGGYLVNSLAVGVTLSNGQTLEEALTASGDRVSEVLSNSNILVAGFNASDTEAAAKDLITALDSLLS